MGNLEQWKGVLRAVIPAILAYVAAAGWISEGNIPTYTAIAITIVTAIWSMMTHTETNAVNIVGAIADKPFTPDKAVKGVILMPTAAGVALSKVTPSTVVTAGTTQAEVMASPGITRRGI